MISLLRTVAFATLAIGFANSAAAGVRALECDGCSPLQEEQKALSAPGRGHLFVYNISGNRIRKFEIILMANGLLSSPTDSKQAQGAKNSATLVASDSHTTAGASTEAGGNVTRELWEYRVDADVKRIFDAIVHAESQIPGVVARNRSVEVPIRNIGLTPGPIGPRPHDPRDVAWAAGAPQGADYVEFMDRLQDQLGDRASAAGVSPIVAEVLFDIQGQTRGASIEVGNGSIAAGINWERISPSLTIKLCDNQGNCVRVTVKRENGVTQTTYEGVTDTNNVTLPTKDQARGVDLEWRANGREGANAYANWLRDRGRATIEYVGGQQFGCGGYILSCVRIEGTTMLACQLHCQ